MHLVPDHLICIGLKADPMRPTEDMTVVSLSDYDGLNWQPFAPMPDPRPWPWRYHGHEFTTDYVTGTVIVATDWWGNSGNTELYGQRSSDGGLTWKSPVFLLRNIDWQNYYFRPFHHGKLWGIVAADELEDGVYWRFSANDGEDWYPPQRIRDYHERLQQSDGQFLPGEVRVYFKAYTPDTISYIYDWWTIRGTVTEDSIRPEAHVELIRPDTLQAGGVECFST